VRCPRCGKALKKTWQPSGWDCEPCREWWHADTWESEKDQEAWLRGLVAGQERMRERAAKLGECSPDLLIDRRIRALPIEPPEDT